MSVMEMIPMGETFQPSAGTLPASLIAVNAISNTRQSFTNLVEYRWDDTDFKFNNMGQKWKTDIRPTFTGPDAYGGVKNCATPRRYSAPAAGISNNFFSCITEFDILFTGDKISITEMNLGGDGSPDPGGDTQVMIEYQGKMYDLSDRPKTVTRTDGAHSHYNIQFTKKFVNARMRFRFGTAGFTSLVTEASSIIKPAPPTLSGIVDGDSWVESSQALTADSTTQWFTTGISNFLSKFTGYKIIERGQGATGLFSNGAAKVFTDAVASATSYILFIAITITGLSRWASGGGIENLSSRLGWITNAAGALAHHEYSPFVNYPGEDFGQPLGRRPVFYMFFGTWNDASVGGVTFEEMYTRAKEVYAAMVAIDPYCIIIHVSPEPFDDTLFGAAIGPPRYGDKSDIHVRAQMKAASEFPTVHYINLFGPDDPAWTGAGPADGGTQGVPTNSQQAQVVSQGDGIHYRYEGGRYAASKVRDKMAKILVFKDRVEGRI